VSTYTYACKDEECGTSFEDEASMSSFKEHHPPCPKCGKPCDYKFVAYMTHGILKDGPSGSWPSKGERFKNYRAKQSEAAGKRQKDRFGHLRKDAVPNYKGQETGSWQDAQIAAMRDKGAESAATFNDKVQSEKKAVEAGKIKI
jgi:hypothetical protein